MADLEKKILVSVSADTTEATQSLDTLKDGIDKVNNSPIDKPFTSIKAEIKAATQEAIRMEQQFGKNSTEFINAGKKVAELKDRFNDVNKSIEAFNPDNKLQALVSVARGATGAIQGVTGAMAFLGVESDEANETIAKLQGLMNFSQALNSVDDIKNGFSNFASVLGITRTKAQESTAALNAQSTATKATTIATKAFGTAFKAIGIGLIVSAIAYLAENWDSVKNAVIKLIPALGNIGGVFNRVKEIAMGVGNAVMKFVLAPMKALYALATEGPAAAMKALQTGGNVIANFQQGQDKQQQQNLQNAANERLASTIKNRDREIEVIKAKGADAYALEKKNITDKLQLAQKGSEEYADLKQQEALLDASHTKKLSDQSKQAAEKRKEVQAKIAADNKEAEDKYKEHLRTVEKITDEAQKSIALSKMSDRERELFSIQTEFAEKEKSSQVPICKECFTGKECH